MPRLSLVEKYAREFEACRNRLLATDKDEFVFTSRKSKKEIVITREDFMNYVQCVTNDVTAKHYFARQGLPKHWFTSLGGSVLSIKDGEIKYVEPSLCGYENNLREQYEISEIKKGKPGKYHGILLDPAAIVGLSFDAEATPEAQEMLDRYGLLAFQKTFGAKTVDVHHIEGYNKDAPPSELRAYNCDLSRIRFETAEVHNLHTSGFKTKESEVIFAQMHTAMSQKNETTTVYTSSTGGKGDIFVAPFTQEQNDYLVEKFNQGRVTHVILQYDTHLMFADGKEVVSGVDIPEGFYDECVLLYKKAAAITKQFNEPISIGWYKDREIFGALRSA